MADAKNTPDILSWSNIAATPSAFKLKGGYYSLCAVATWGGGSIKLQRLSADSSTYVDTALTLTANGISNGYLANGTYKLLVATVSAIYADLTAIS